MIGTIVHTAILVELPVITAALLAAIGWILRRGSYKDEQRDAALAKQSEALAVLVASQGTWRDWQQSTDRKINHNSSAISRLESTTERLSDVIERGRR